MTTCPGRHGCNGPYAIRCTNGCACWVKKRDRCLCMCAHCTACHMGCTADMLDLRSLTTHACTRSCTQLCQPETTETTAPTHGNSLISSGAADQEACFPPARHATQHAQALNCTRHWQGLPEDAYEAAVRMTMPCGRKKFARKQQAAAGTATAAGLSPSS
jgi:hypothetical protein